MNRDLSQLADNCYDVCVIGGGIYGACVAWDATLRGLSVALVDKGDFGNATSSNSLRILHGGFRNLQYGDIIGVRRQIRERMVWMRIAPHLVDPLPVLIPIYGGSVKWKTILSVAVNLYNLLSISRHGLESKQKRIAGGRIISRQECLRFLPELSDRDLSGGAIFHDAQMYSSERLLLSFIKSAARAGAKVANYVEVIDFLRHDGSVTGVKALDVFRRDVLEIRAEVVVNAAGPWIYEVIERLRGQRPQRPVVLSKAFNLVIPQIFPKWAVALRGEDARYFFITPWHGRSMIGTAHLPSPLEDPDCLRVDKEDVHHFIRQINRARPKLSVDEKDVLHCHRGLLLSGENGSAGHRVELLREHEIIDHSKTERLDGIISVMSVKFTTARQVAEEVVDRVFRKLGYEPPKSRTADTPVYGGDIDNFDRFLAQVIAESPAGLNEPNLTHLVRNYGSAYDEVLAYADQELRDGEGPEDDLEVLKAEVRHAVWEEMAQELEDVVFRRTEGGALGFPGDAWLGTCAAIMAKELGWSKSRTETQIDRVRRRFSMREGYA